MLFPGKPEFNSFDSHRDESALSKRENLTPELNNFRKRLLFIDRDDGYAAALDLEPLANQPHPRFGVAAEAEPACARPCSFFRREVALIRWGEPDRRKVLRTEVLMIKHP